MSAAITGMKNSQGNGMRFGLTCSGRRYHRGFELLADLR